MMNEKIALYPTARKVEDLLKRASRSATLLGCPMMTLPQLVDRLWRETAPQTAILDELQERLAVEEAIAAAGGTLGSADHVMGLIRQFKSAGVGPADLRRASEAAAGALRKRTDGLAGVFDCYERLLKECGVCDRHDRERAVLDRLLAFEKTRSRPAALEGVTQLRIAEIYDFSLLQFMIVSALIRIVGDATLTIQAAEYPAASERFAELTWNRFVAEESIADMVLPAFVRRDGRPGRLGFVLEHLFLETAGSLPSPDDTIQIVEAPTALGEIEEVARAIRRAMEGPAPIAAERIAVVARSLTPYAAHLRTVFGRYGIPLQLEDPAPLRASAPARAVFDILRAARERFSREALAAICRSPHLKSASPGLVPMLAEIGYVDAGARPLLERLDSFVSELRRAAAIEADGERRARIESRAERIERRRPEFDLIVGALEPLAGTGTLSDHLARLQSALEVLGYDPAAGLDVDGVHDESARAAGPVLAAIGGIARWDLLAQSGRRIEAAEFARFVENAFDCAPAAAEPDVASGVAALPVLEARGLDFDLVFVIGLNDGLFPRYHREDPLLPDEMKRALSGPLGKALRARFGTGAPSRPGPILRTRRERNGEDFFLFFLALSMPSRRVVLSYAAADAGGNPIVRSPFIDEVLRLLGDSASVAKPRITAAHMLVPEIDDCFSRDEFLARAALGKVLDSGGTEIIAEAAVRESICSRSEIERAREEYLNKPTREDHAEPDEDGLRYWADRERFASADAWNGRVKNDGRLARLIYGDPADPRRWSATQVNQLASCGYRYFAARVLGLSEEDDQDYELSALESGEILHDVLKQLVDGVGFRDRKQTARDAPAILKKIGEARRALSRDPAFFDIRWDRICEAAADFVQYEDAYRKQNPNLKIQTEAEFDFQIARLKDAGGPALRMGGRIDRLETHRCGKAISKIRVLDYKDSARGDEYANRANPQKALFGWIDFQLAIYVMSVLAKAGAARGTLEAGYYVLRARDRKKREQVFAIESPAVELDPKQRAMSRKAGEHPIADRIFALVDSAARGEFDVDPRQCDEYCEYRSLCRYYKAADR
jgi:PD-(D/E)XK nuclease superfamily protein